MVQPSRKTFENKETERANLRTELDSLEVKLSELKVFYEQYFMGIHSLPPDKLHAEVKRSIRRLRGAPFKSSEIAFRLRTLENRYNTFKTYWERVLKEREAGSYVRDVFKANLRQKIAKEEEAARTAQGAAEKSMRALFQSYKTALEKQTGQKQTLDFNAFRKSLMVRARDLKQRLGVKKLTFKVVVKNGKVVVQAKPKENPPG